VLRECGRGANGEVLHFRPVQPVLILRHGESEWNVERRWQGWLDAPLTALGEAQATARGRQLARDGMRPRAVYASDLGRATRTAEILAAHLDVPLIVEPGFRERHVGEWEGRTSDEIDELWPGLREQWRRGELDSPPGGESDRVVLERFDRALVHALAHVGTGMLLVVTHHGTLRSVAARAGVNTRTLIPNLAGFWFDIDNDGSLRNPVALDTLPDDAEHASVE
jgi:probable phosphoglycerate mutase